MRRRVGRGMSAILIALWLLPPVPARAAAPIGGAGSAARSDPRAQAGPEPTPPPPSPAVSNEAPKVEASPGEQVMVLSLRDCLTQALENNLDIAVRRFDPLRSEAGVTLDQAAFDPLLTASATGTENVQKGISSFFGPFSSTDRRNLYAVGFADPLTTGGNYRVDVTASDDRNTNFQGISSLGYNAGWQVTLNHPLLRNLGRETNLWLVVTARNTLTQSESRFRQQVIETLAAAEKAYWDLNFALLNLKTQQTAQQLARNFLEESRIKVRVGTLAPIEITQAEAGVADREEGVIEAGNLVRTSEDAVRRILNVAQDSPLWSERIQPSDPPPIVEVAPELQEAVAAAMARRPDLEQARLDLKNREVEKSYRTNQRRWDLSFQGIYGSGGFSSIDYGDAYDELGHRNLRNWSLGLSLGVPIGNRQAVANYTNAEYALEQARYALQNLEQAARVEVRTAVRTVETNLKRVKAAQVNTRLQREKLDAEQKKFNNGMSTSFQVLSFQNDLASAESRENQAIVDYNKSLVEMERVKGTLLESKKIVVPGTTGADRGKGASAALRPFLPPRPPAEAALVFAPGPYDPLRLPDRFVFDGRALRAFGGR